MDWTYRLSAQEVAELDAALPGIRARGLSIPDIQARDFPLAKLPIKQIKNELESGGGVMLLRGLPVARWGEADSLLAYWGLSAHLGEITAQNAKGELLGSVRATGRDW